MAHIQYLDELIREYLLFRGFGSTLKCFDSELKTDKDKGFRVDRVVEQLLQYINTYDLMSLRELWTHLDQRMFSKLEQDYIPAVRKLESSLFKLYLINAVSNNKPDRVTEFFNKMTFEIQGQPEWKDWFMLPFTKNPEDNPIFAMHFSKQWQDTLLVSIHNFLAIIYQVMPQPVLSSYEEEATKLRKLQEENEILKQKLATLTQCSNVIPDAVPPMDIMDDFYIIAQENPTSSENQVGKTLKSVFNVIGGGIPTSPVLGRKPQDDQFSSHKQSYPGKQRHISQGSSKSSSVDSVPKRSLSLDSRSRRAAGRDVSLENVDRRSGAKKDTFLLLSQDKMGEHKSAVTQCRFNVVGSLVASCDMDGVIKVWSAAPSPKIVSTIAYSEVLVALSWVAKNERYFVTGSKNGVLRLHDTKENKKLWEIGEEESNHLKDSQILSISCSPTECTVACTTMSRNQGNGKLLLFDIKSRKLERCFNLGETEIGLVANCCMYNHNGSLVVAGCSDGQVRTLDLRHSEVLDSWEVHEGPVTAIHATPDHNACYTMGADHKLSRLSMTQNGESCWSAMLPKCHTTHGTQGFSLHQTGKHVLTACGHTGGNIFQLTPGGMQLMLHLGGHRSPLVACDWTTANQCTTCLSASSDGKIKVSTILTP